MLRFDFETEDGNPEYFDGSDTLITNQSPFVAGAEVSVQIINQNTFVPGPGVSIT